MPISKIKSNAINDGAITIAKTNNLFVNTEIAGTEAVKVPVGTTAQRANAKVGDLRHNTNLGILEQYTSDGWQGIASAPTVTSISPTNIEESDSTQTIVVTGQNFDSGATAVLVGSGGNVTPTTSTRNSASQITIVFSGSDVITTDAGPYDIKVTNSTGLAGTLDDSLTLDNKPTWSTAAGNVANVIEDEAMSTATVAAADPEGGSVTYSITSGALPSGLSFGTSNGQITGTPNAGNAGYSASGVTHNFTVTANDGTGNTTPRAFNIIRKWRDGSTQALAATSLQHIKSATGTTADGTFWVDPTGSAPYQVHGYNSIESGGWELAYRFGTNGNSTYEPSGTWGVSDWGGWAVTKTKTAVDALSGNNSYATAADNDSMSPSFVYTPFVDIMIISNRSGQTSKRSGYRFGSTVNNLRDVTGGTSSTLTTTNVLFGSLQWLTVLDIKSSVSSIDAWTGGADFFGFKARSDGGSTTPTALFTGGFHTSTMHYGSQIGTGRNSGAPSGQWSGGFGGAYSGASYYAMHGHWWGHGTTWQSDNAYQGDVFYGHAVYIRSNAS